MNYSQETSRLKVISGKKKKKSFLGTDREMAKTVELTDQDIRLHIMCVLNAQDSREKSEHDEEREIEDIKNPKIELLDVKNTI